MKEVSLTNQLISICILIVGIICITLGIILPKELLPIYEENIYNKLKQPLIFVNDEDDINKEDINSETISFEIRNILFEEEKNNIFQCYANGGPQIKLEIFLTPSLSIDDSFNLGTGCMKGYKLSLNINIAPFNNFSLFPLEIESEFSMDYKDCLKWSVDNIEIL